MSEQMETPLERYLRESVKIFQEHAERANEQLRPVINAIKYSAVLPVSKELLMDEGIIPDTRPKPPPPTRRQRFRWWRSRQRERLAYWLFAKLAGYEVPDPDDYR